MLVTASDGGRWRVGKRRLPWKPDPFVLDFMGRVHGALDEFSVLVFILLAPVLVPLLVVYVLSWTVSLAITPILALCRAWGVVRVKVVAYPVRIKRKDRPGLYHAVVDVDEAESLVSRVTAELRQHGDPRLLDHSARGQ